MAQKLRVVVVGDVTGLKAAMGEAAGTMEAVGSKLTSVGKTLTTHLTLPIVAIGAVSTKMAMDFQNSMELIHTQAGRSQDAVESFSKSVLKLAGPTATAPEELSKGLFHLASQGLNGAKAMDALKIAAEGAKMGQADLEDVTNALGAVISSNIKGSRNYEQAMGELNATVGAGDMRMQDLADAMGTGLPAKAAIFGVSLRQVSAALATFGDNNIRGAEAGTLLNSTMRIMGAPSKAAAKALGEVGIGALQLGNDMRSGGIVGAIEDLKSHFDKLGLTASEQAQVLTRAFGGRQAGGVMILMDQLERLKSKVKEVGDGGQNFAKDWESYTKTTAFHMASMGASMRAAGITIGDILLPVVAKIADFIGKLASRFQDLNPNVKTAILVIGGVVAAAGPLLMILGGIATGLAAIASPVGLIVVGLAAAAAALVAFYMHSKKFREEVQHMVEEVKADWPQIRAEAERTFTRVEALIRDLVTAGEALWRAFGSTLISYARSTFQNLVTYLQGAFDVIEGLFRLVGDVIHGRWGKAWKDVEEIVHGALLMVEAALRQAVNVIETLAKMIGIVLVKAFEWAKSAVVALVKKLVELSIAELRAAPSQALAVAKLIGEAILKGVEFDIIKLPELVLSLVKKAVHEVEHLAGEALQEGEKVGEALGHGVAHGIRSTAHSIFEAAASVIPGASLAMQVAGKIGSPSKLTRDEVGKPLAEGVIIGMEEGLRPLGGKMSKAIREAIAQGRIAVESARQSFTTAWNNLMKDAMQAFDAQTNAGLQQIKNRFEQAKSLLDQQLAEVNAMLDQEQQQLTPEEQKVQDEQDAHDEAQRQQAISDAQKQLSSDTASGADAGTIEQDQRALNEALYQEQLAADQKAAAASRKAEDAKIAAEKAANAKITKERKAALTAQEKTAEQHYKAAREQQRHALDQQLRDLEAALKKAGASQKKAQQEIIALLKSYGITYEASGRALGNAFAKGLASTEGAVAAAARQIAQAAADNLKLNSPAKKGPLSTLPTWWTAFPQTLLGGLDGKGIESGLVQMLNHSAAAVKGWDGGSLGIAPTTRGASGRLGRAAGGVTHIEVNMPHYLGDKREVAETLRRELIRTGRQNGSIFGGLA
jgi:TP901 family phage tail tape measure protein